MLARMIALPLGHQLLRRGKGLIVRHRLAGLESFELERRLAVAPSEHAEALLAALDLLEEAHRHGVLEALHGAIGARDTILALGAQYAAEPANVIAVRNLLAAAKLAGALDPDRVARCTREVAAAIHEHQLEKQPPSPWRLLRRMREPDARRGLSLLTSLLAALGRGTK